MKKKKKILSLFLVFSLVLSFFIQINYAYSTNTTVTEENIANELKDSTHINKEKLTMNSEIETQSEPELSNGTSLSDWQYAQNDDTKTYQLYRYQGTSTDIVVPGSFGDDYKVEIKSLHSASTHTFPLNMTSLTIGTPEKKVRLFPWPYGSSSRNSSYFSNYNHLKKADLSGLDVSDITDFSYAFADCTALEELNISNWDVSNVKKMEGMFQICESLSSLDLHEWKVDNVTTMKSMFSNCKNLIYLNANGWNINNVTTTQSMFMNCSALRSVNTEGWFVTKNGQSPKNTKMLQMFQGCNSLESLDVSDWETGEVQYMENMFNNCRSIELLDVSHWNMSKVKNANYMFENCQKLSSLNVTNWSTNSLAKVQFMFRNCKLFQFIDLSNWNLSTIESNENFNKQFLAVYCDNDIPTLIVTPNDPSSAARLKNFYENDNDTTTYFKNRIPAGPIYDANGGEFADGTTDNKRYFDSMFIDDKTKLKVTQKTVSEKYTPKSKIDGEIFLGWYLEEECKTLYKDDTTPVDLSLPQSMNLTLYAKYGKPEKEITFKVVNGTWKNGKTDDITLKLPLKDAAGEPSASGNASLKEYIPTGMLPFDEYGNGSWNIELPETVSGMDAMTYIFTFKKNPVYQNVIFKVVNGTWKDGTTEDIIVKLELKDAAGEPSTSGSASLKEYIPIGMLPFEHYENGSWDIEPPETITQAESIIYTYTFTRTIDSEPSKPTITVDKNPQPAVIDKENKEILTGDNTNIQMYIIILIIAAVCVIILGNKIKKK